MYIQFGWYLSCDFPVWRGAHPVSSRPKSQRQRQSIVSDQQYSLRGRTALVTGSSRGIGAAIALALARAGASVAVHGRDIAAVEDVASNIRAQGSRAISVTGDVTKAADLGSMRNHIEAEFGAPDIVVTNAGGNSAPPGNFEDIAEDDWNSTITGNLTSTFLTIKAFLPSMKARGGGNIITMASAAARKPSAQAPVAYGAAKAGIILLTQSLALQVGQFGIRANCISPGAVLTERNLERIPAKQQQSMAEQHPLKRLGQPEDIAEAAVYLAGDLSSWITGVVLDVAGGTVTA